MSPLHAGFFMPVLGEKPGPIWLREMQKNRRLLAARTHLLARDKSGYAASPAA